MISILIPAAGKSTRMRGEDKLLRKVDGVPILRRTVETAIATGYPVWVALPAYDCLRSEIIADLNATIIAVPNSNGLSDTLRIAVRHLGTETDVMIALADLPELTTADCLTIAAARGSNPDAKIWRGTADGTFGHPTLFDRSIVPEFRNLSGDNGARDIVRKYGAHPVPLLGKRAIRDLDTPEDWAEYEKSRR